MNFYIQLTEEEIHYLQRLVNVDVHRQIEDTDHALSHGTRGFVAMESKVARGVGAKMEATIVMASFDLGTETAKVMEQGTDPKQS